MLLLPYLESNLFQTSASDSLFKTDRLTQSFILSLTWSHSVFCYGLDTWISKKFS
jgi:hypothetical protein